MFNFKLVTPEGIAFNEDVEMVIVRTLAGDRGILENHIPMVSIVKESTLKVKKNGNFQEFQIEEGFVEVSKSGTVVITDGIK